MSYGSKKFIVDASAEFDTQGGNHLASRVDWQELLDRYSDEGRLSNVVAERVLALFGHHPPCFTGLARSLPISRLRELKTCACDQRRQRSPGGIVRTALGPLIHCRNGLPSQALQPRAHVPRN